MEHVVFPLRNGDANGGSRWRARGAIRESVSARISELKVLLRLLNAHIVLTLKGVTTFQY